MWVCWLRFWFPLLSNLVWGSRTFDTLLIPSVGTDIATRVRHSSASKPRCKGRQRGRRRWWCLRICCRRCSKEKYVLSTALSPCRLYPCLVCSVCQISIYLLYVSTDFPSFGTHVTHIFIVYANIHNYFACACACVCTCACVRVNVCVRVRVCKRHAVYKFRSAVVTVILCVVLSNRWCFNFFIN